MAASNFVETIRSKLSLGLLAGTSALMLFMPQRAYASGPINPNSLPIRPTGNNDVVMGVVDGTAKVVGGAAQFVFNGIANTANFVFGKVDTTGVAVDRMLNSKGVYPLPPHNPRKWETTVGNAGAAPDPTYTSVPLPPLPTAQPAPVVEVTQCKVPNGFNVTNLHPADFLGSGTTPPATFVAPPTPNAWATASYDSLAWIKNLGTSASNWLLDNPISHWASANPVAATAAGVAFVGYIAISKWRNRAAARKTKETAVAPPPVKNESDPGQQRKPRVKPQAEPKSIRDTLMAHQFGDKKPGRLTRAASAIGSVATRPLNAVQDAFSGAKKMLGNVALNYANKKFNFVDALKGTREIDITNTFDPKNDKNPQMVKHGHFSLSQINNLNKTAAAFDGIYEVSFHPATVNGNKVEAALVTPVDHNSQTHHGMIMVYPDGIALPPDASLATVEFAAQYYKASGILAKNMPIGATPEQREIFAAAYAGKQPVVAPVAEAPTEAPVVSSPATTDAKDPTKAPIDDVAHIRNLAASGQDKFSEKQKLILENLRDDNALFKDKLFLIDEQAAKIYQDSASEKPLFEVKPDGVDVSADCNDNELRELVKATVAMHGHVLDIKSNHNPELASKLISIAENLLNEGALVVAENKVKGTLNKLVINGVEFTRSKRPQNTVQMTAASPKVA